MIYAFLTILPGEFSKTVLNSLLVCLRPYLNLAMSYPYFLWTILKICKKYYLIEVKHKGFLLSIKESSSGFYIK